MRRVIKEVWALEEERGDDLDLIREAIKGFDLQEVATIIKQLVDSGKVDSLSAGLFYGRIGRIKAEE